MQNINKKKYEQYVKQLTPTHSLPLNMAKAFLTGGLICLLGQVILNTAQALGADASDSRTWCSVTSHSLKRPSHRLWYLSRKSANSAVQEVLFPLPDSPTQWLHPPLSSGQKDRFSA